MSKGMERSENMVTVGNHEKVCRTAGEGYVYMKADNDDWKHTEVPYGE